MAHSEARLRVLGVPAEPHDKLSTDTQSEGEMVLFEDALARLRRDFPTVSPSRLRAVLIAEWEASTGGWPIVVPADVEVGAHETLLRAR